MNASDALALAASKNDVSDLLRDIKNVAVAGHTQMFTRRLLNQFEIKALVVLGYWVEGSDGQEDIGMSYGAKLASPHIRHLIDWSGNNPRESAYKSLTEKCLELKK